MHRATSSLPPTHDASSTAHHRSRRTRISRAQLLRRLETLGRPSQPLPIELPLPSAASSASSSKRKPEADTQPGPSKRPRTSSVSDSRRQAPPSSAHRSEAAPVSHRRPNPPPEDGELYEEPPASRDPSQTTNIPIRRQRRQPPPVLGRQHFEGMYERYYSSGMHLKCSGQLRTMANERPDSPSYRPLPYPPPTSSPYHKYGNLMSRLECLESIIDFCYAFWAKDFWHKRVDRNAWRGLQPFLAFTRAHWEQDAVDDREKALLGLLYMFEACVLSNKLRESARSIDYDNRVLICRLQKQFVEDEQRKAAEKSKATDGSESLATPPMLPSPASISSTDSTPPSKEPETNEPATATVKGMPIALRNPDEVWEIAVPENYYTEVNWKQVRMRKSESEGIMGLVHTLHLAQEHFTLPILAKLYPRTFKRILNTTYSATDEYHPDIEDEDGELFWPGQVMAGGVAWYCAVGKAMLKEFSKEYGYRSIDGAISKRDMDFRELQYKVAAPPPWGERPVER